MATTIRTSQDSFEIICRAYYHQRLTRAGELRTHFGVGSRCACSLMQVAHGLGLSTLEYERIRTRASHHVKRILIDYARNTTTHSTGRRTPFLPCYETDVPRRALDDATAD